MRHFLSKGTVLSIVFLLLSSTGLRAINVLTQHNDISRTGADLVETLLTPANVNTNQFGKLFTRSVDGAILAQPLYVQGLTISNKTQNVVFVATEHDSVYAFDADNPAVSTPLWQVSLGTSVPYTEIHSCLDVTPEVGITSTPVIDLGSGTLYLDAMSKVAGGGATNYFHHLHALDITTGAEKFGGPVAIQGTVGSETFNSLHNHQRPGLLLLNNVVYLGFGSHCDWTPYDGWLMGYNATNLSQVSIFCTTPNGVQGGIWSSGTGLAADTNGNIYLATGNGTFDANTGGPDYAQSFLKFSTTNGLTLADWFAAHNAVSLSSTDADIGSGAPILLPGTHLMAGLDKVGTMFLIDQDNLGHFTSNSTDTNIVQEFQATPYGDTVSQCPVYWNGPGNNQYLYISCASGQAKAFLFNGSTVQTNPVGIGPVTNGNRTGGLSLSANGNTNGVLWVINGTSSGELWAYDAANMPTVLWNSQQKSSRDAFGAYVKNCSPTIANGKVYAPSSSGLVVYGLFVPTDFSLSASPPAQLVGTQATNVNYTVGVADANGFSGSVSLGVVNGLPPGAQAGFNVNPVNGNGSSTLTVTTTDGTPQGSYLVTIAGIGGGQTNTTTATLNVSTGAGPGTLAWTGSGSDTNWSTALNWTNVTAGGYGPPGFLNNILFTNTAAVASPGAINNVVDGSLTVEALQYVNNANPPAYQVTLIGSGQTLAVTNGLTVGTATDAGANALVNAVITGANGTLLMSNSILAVTQGSASDGAHQAVLDLSGLGTFDAVNVVRIAIAAYNVPPQAGNGGMRSSGVLYLARTNFISLTSTGITNGILVGWNDNQGNITSADQGSALYLGQTNVIFTDSLHVGTDKTTGCLLAFNPVGLSNPSAYFRNRDGTSRISFWGVGDTSMKNNSNENAAGTNDFTGGTVDALVASLNIGASTTGNNTGASGNGTGVLTFNAGTIDVNNLTNGWSTGSGTTAGSDLGTGTINVNGSATLKVNQILAFAQNTGTGTGTSTGTLNVGNGGTVLVGSIVAGGGTSSITLNNGTLVLTNTAGTAASPLTTFNLTGSALHLNVNGAASLSDIMAANLTAGEVNTITLDSVANVTGVTTNHLISYATFNGSVSANFVLSPLPAGFAGALLDNAGGKSIDLVVSPGALVMPRIGGIALSGANLIVSGTNGLPNGNYYVLTSTNLALPAAGWLRVLTNPFDGSGHFIFTNPVGSAVPQTFYRLQLP